MLELKLFEYFSLVPGVDGQDEDKKNGSADWAGKGADPGNKIVTISKSEMFEGFRWIRSEGVRGGVPSL